ncbi:MAG: CDP-diacylglycerol--glycerol-3-phosphate 3-phosphatidyltransferase [Actinobacteria bacterium]|nr:CDP-diacylglycerol--glycerol-3-phosphate 3-phosphatidyltransferase [Actinomycetota bacterium]
MTQLPGQEQVDKPSNWNVPNALTSLRLLLVPVFGYFLLAQSGQNETYRLIAAGIFVIASITDYFDGYLARRNNLVTSFGKIADPIADKALTGLALIGMSILAILPWWVTIVILGRELLVTLIRFAVIKDGVIPASRGGKAKTVSQMLAILLYLLPLSGYWLILPAVVMGIAVVLTVVTGIDYVARALSVRRGAQLRREAFDEN